MSDLAQTTVVQSLDPAPVTQWRFFLLRPIDLRVLITVLLSGALAISAACDEPTAAPTPTPTPIPTLTPTPTPTTDAGAAGLSSGQPVAEKVAQLLSAVPVSYETVMVTDVGAMKQDPSLQAVLQDQDILAALGPAAGPIQDLVDAVAVAVDDDGILGIFRASSDAAGVLGSLGALASGAAPEAYGPFEITEVNINLPLLKLSLALSVLDERTAIFATATSEDVSAGDVIKAALDAAQQTGPGFLSDSSVTALAAEIPQGFITLVSTDCSALGETLLEGIEACTGIAISATQEAEAAFLNGVVGFDSAGAAEAAMPAINEQLEMAGGLSDSPVQSLAEGDRVRFRIPVDLSAGLLEQFGLGSP